VLTGGTAREVIEIGSTVPDSVPLQTQPVRRVSFIEGTVEVSVESPKGPLVISTSGANEIIGEIGIFGDVPRTATVTATSRVEALKISKELFINIIRQNPDAAIEVLRVLATRLANTTKQLTRTVGGTK